MRIGGRSPARICPSSSSRRLLCRPNKKARLKGGGRELGGKEMSYVISTRTRHHRAARAAAIRAHKYVYTHTSLSLALFVSFIFNP